MFFTMSHMSKPSHVTFMGLHLDLFLTLAYIPSPSLYQNDCFDYYGFVINFETGNYVFQLCSKTNKQKRRMFYLCRDPHNSIWIWGSAFPFYRLFGVALHCNNMNSSSLRNRHSSGCVINWTAFLISFCDSSLHRNTNVIVCPFYSLQCCQSHSLMLSWIFRNL